ncbi:MAG TPA: phosphodiester glycosidase family protein, partial [Kofleriaceae bacterium]|nr:phosphodiester glycosidase family protein [Kofleriaceae bacterium]
SEAPVVVAGRDCKDFDLAKLRQRYRSIVQSYRLLGCDGKAMTWGDPKHYSAAAIGVDRSGRVVMMLARGAVTMAELSKELAGHDLAGALFLEGGPEASLVVRGKLSVLGSYETGFVENDDNHEFWKLPNVIGVLARSP